MNKLDLIPLNEPSELEYYEGLLQQVEEELEDEGLSDSLLLRKEGILLKIEEINARELEKDLNNKYR